DPADVPPDPPDPDRDRRLSQGLRRARRSEGRWLSRPTGRIDPVTEGDPGATPGGRSRGGARARPPRERRRPPLARPHAPARGARNRAKGEPFVIYMMSVLSDVSLHRAGFEPELRDRIAAAWRAEDYTTAGNLIPDELLDAFMLCGTRDDVAAGAMAFHVETGLHLPLLQPVLQEDRQIDELVAAAATYAGLPDPTAVVATARAATEARAAAPRNAAHPSRR